MFKVLKNTLYFYMINKMLENNMTELEIQSTNLVAVRRREETVKTRAS